MHGLRDAVGSKHQGEAILTRDTARSATAFWPRQPEQVSWQPEQDPDFPLGGLRWQGPWSPLADLTKGPRPFGRPDQDPQFPLGDLSKAQGCRGGLKR
jgi:hypothetical protein